MLGVLVLATLGRNDDLAAVCVDRAAIERVYHDHRTGTKPAFEQAMSRELIAKLELDVYDDTIIHTVAEARRREGRHKGYC